MLILALLLPKEDIFPLPLCIRLNRNMKNSIMMTIIMREGSIAASMFSFCGSLTVMDRLPLSTTFWSARS